MTSRPLRGAAFAAALVAGAGCGSSAAPPSPSAPGHGALGGGDVARVGAEPVPAELVKAVAEARGATPADVLSGLVDDATFAAGATARSYGERAAVVRDVRAVRARLVVDRIRREAAAAGPLSDAEIAKLTERHWRDVARPESVHVVHAIVMRPKSGGAALVARAREAAAKLHDAVADAASTEDFEARARAFPKDGLDVRVEDLPAFIADGRIVEVDGTMDATFARAAFDLPASGAISGVVETPFGFHVLRLVERIPPRTKPLEERRALFAEEGLTARAEERYASLLTSLRASAPVEIRADAEAAMASAVAFSPARDEP